jgi:hypothetical protein
MNRVTGQYTEDLEQLLASDPLEEDERADTANDAPLLQILRAFGLVLMVVVPNAPSLCNTRTFVGPVRS